MNTLHVYGQSAWHDDVWIAGTVEGLAALRAALDHEWDEVITFANDGEGFSINVRCFTDEQMETLKTPYSEQIAQDEAGVWPWMVETE